MNVFDLRMILELLLKIWDVVQEMAGGATIVILLVLICRLFIRKVSKKACYFLWAIVALRLICPVMLPSQFSIFNTFENKNVVRLENAATSIIQLEPSDNFDSSDKLQINGTVDSGDLSAVQPSEDKVPLTNNNMEENHAGNGLSVQKNPVQTETAANMINITLPFLLWLIGMCIIFAAVSVCTGFF